MPRREDIERFAQVLNSLGDEPAIRAARSETIEEVPAPSEEAPPAGELAPGEEAAEPGAAPEEAGFQDLFEGLSTTPEGPEERGGPAPGEPAPAQEPLEEPEGIDFGSLLGDETSGQPIEDIAPAPRAPGAPPEGAEEEFSFPEGEPSGFQSDLSEMEVVPEGAEPAAEPVAGETAPDTDAPEAGLPEAGASEAGLPEAGLPEPGPFEDLGDFSFDAPQATEPAAESPEEPAAFELPADTAPAPSAGGEGQELPDLDDLSFAETPAPEPVAETAPSFEAPAESPPPGEPAPQEPPSGAESAGGFDLDTATFEPPAPEEPPPRGAPRATQPEPDTSSVDLEAGGEETLGNLDEFSLPSGAERFGVKPEAPPPPKSKPAAARPRPAARPAVAAVAAGAAEISLTPAQFAQVRKTLESLPRNLKIVVQDLIGEGTVVGEDLARLVGLLVSGASAQEIAALAGRVTGRRIRIPAGYEKRTGAALEAEQRTFGYAFRQNILPLVRVLAITLVFGALFGYLGYRYVYRPLAALSAYRAGYAQIGQDNYAAANDRFNAAVNVWPMKRWYFRYAEGFAGERQYVLAEEKYDQLLTQFGYDKNALLEYAGMETTQLADYEKADTLLKRILDRSQYDYDALLASGDNDIEWAATDGTRFEAARLAYATLLDRYGVQDELLFRMLRYFIRTDNALEVERLRAYYATKPDVKVDASVYAELGGYLVDHRRLDNVQQVLFRADKANPLLYDVHYNLARYYRLVGRSADEKSALDHVVALLKLTGKEALTRRRLSIEIDTHTRLGEWWYAQQGYIDAGNELRTAIDLLERNQRMKLITPNRIFGRPYAALGDLYYYIQGDLGGAEVQYRNAIANLYTNPSLTYKLGYIEYARGDYKAAVTTFTSTEDAVARPAPDDTENLPSDVTAAVAGPATDAASATPGATATGGAQRSAGAGSAAAPAPQVLPGQIPLPLLYALGNSFFMRGDYFAAQGTYLRLLDRLEARREAIGTLLPDSRPADKTLLQNIARVDNNLGVTMLQLSARTGDRGRRSQALVYLTASTEISDSLARNLSSEQRSENRSLASLNMRGILYPTAQFTPQIGQQLPRDLQTTSW